MPERFSRRAMLGSSAALVGAGLLPPAHATDPQARVAAGPVRLLANENPYGPGPAARAALAASTERAWQYAFRRERALREAIAAREGLDADHVMIAAGSGEVLRLVGLMCGVERGALVIARPTFTFAADYARALGATIREVPLDADMRHDLGAMAAAVDARTRLVYVCNPNNPTGTLLSGGELRPFVEALSRQALVVVDEAYLDLNDDQAAHTALPRVAAGDQVIVTRTFSKLHGMAGLRIGYALARPDLIRRLERLRISILNLPGLEAAVASYGDEEFQVFSRARLREGVELTQRLLTGLGRPFVPSAGNFVFFDTGALVGVFADAMRARGFLIGRAFEPYPTWCRVSMGTVEQMAAFGAAARQYFETPRG